MKPSTKRFLIIGVVAAALIVVIVLAFTLSGPEEVPYFGTEPGAVTLERSVDILILRINKMALLLLHITRTVYVFVFEIK